MVGVTDWVEVVAEFGGIDAGDLVPVTLKGLEPGTQVTATLFSDPIDMGTHTSNEAGEARFVMSIPKDLTPGTHTLVLESTDLSLLPVSIEFEVAAASALAMTGAEVGGLLTAGLGLVALGGAALALRVGRRSASAV